MSRFTQQMAAHSVTQLLEESSWIDHVVVLSDGLHAAECLSQACASAPFEAAVNNDRVQVVGRRRRQRGRA
jgi:hypothetical protein